MTIRTADVWERDALEQLQRRSSMHQPMHRGAARIDVVANPQAVAFYEAVGFDPAGEARTRFGSAPRMSRADVIRPRQMTCAEPSDAIWTRP